MPGPFSKLMILQGPRQPRVAKFERRLPACVCRNVKLELFTPSSVRLASCMFLIRWCVDECGRAHGKLKKKLIRKIKVGEKAKQVTETWSARARS
eukprot:3743648-Pleurochrysis_carterae.AAC.1